MEFQYFLVITQSQAAPRVEIPTRSVSQCVAQPRQSEQINESQSTELGLFVPSLMITLTAAVTVMSCNFPLLKTRSLLERGG